VAIYGRVTSHPGELLPAPFQDGHISNYISDSYSVFYQKNGRAGGIRTHDLLNPIQAHYQAVLRPDAKEAKDPAPKWLFQAGKSIQLPGPFDRTRIGVREPAFFSQISYFK
jgi:hypothetical protein